MIALIALSQPLGAQAEPVAVTFDDLPLNGALAPGMTRAAIVEEVLAVLKEHRIPQAYGFINAGRSEDALADGVEALRLWIAGGHPLGNHTYSHPDLHQSSIESFQQDLRRNEPILQLLDPRGAWRWFRYPFLREGDTLEKRRAVRAFVQQRGYRIAQVTLDYEDYLWNTAYARCLGKGDTAAIEQLRASYLAVAEQYLDASRVMAQLVFGREINHVLLLHAGAFSGTILPDLFRLMRRKGFTFVTLEQAHSDPAYVSDPDAPRSRGGTLLEQWMDVRSLEYPPIERKPYDEMAAVCR